MPILSLLLLSFLLYLVPIRDDTFTETVLVFNLVCFSLAGRSWENELAFEWEFETRHYMGTGHGDWLVLENLRASRNWRNTVKLEYMGWADY